MSGLTLKIVTPEGTDKTVDCDSVILWLAADEKGRGEGSIGIRKGHTNTVIALGNGPISAGINGKAVFSGQTQGGFATVFENVVTVVTPHLTI